MCHLLFQSWFLQNNLDMHIDIVHKHRLCGQVFCQWYHQLREECLSLKIRSKNVKKKIGHNFWLLPVRHPIVASHGEQTLHDRMDIWRRQMVFRNCTKINICHCRDPKGKQADILAKKFIQLVWNAHKDSTASTTFLSGSVDFSASEIRSCRVFRPSISSLRYAYEDKNKINGLSKHINYEKKKNDYQERVLNSCWRFCIHYFPSIQFS